MKNSGKIAVMMLMLLIAGSLSLNAQYGMRGKKKDSTGMKRMEPFMCPMGAMGRQAAATRHPGMGMRNMCPGMCMMYLDPGMERPGMGMNQAAGMRRPTKGMRMLENIPNLTDKQKKDIVDLKHQQMVEVKKLKDDMQMKVKDMRISQKTKVLSLLTDEQKKWLEENTSNPLNK